MGPMSCCLCSPMCRPDHRGLAGHYAGERGPGKDTAPGAGVRGALAVLLAVQWGYLIEQSHRSTATVLAQVTETVLVPAQGLQAVIRHPEGYEITLWCPQLAWELLQPGTEYLVTYEWDDRMPQEGTLCMVHP